MARSRFPLFALVAAAIAVAVGVPRAGGQEWLTNGGFESGTDGWSVARSEPLVCSQIHQGSGALGVTAAPGGSTRVMQEVFGALPTGGYTLSGWTRVQDGEAEIDLTMAFTRPFGGPGGITVPVPIATGAQYTLFTITANANFSPESVLVAFDITTDSAAEVCFDGLQLTTTDPAPTVTPTPTATNVPEATATPTLTSTPVSQPGAEDTQTATPAPTSSSTPPAATLTSTPTPTLSPTAGPSFVFTNGGFEQGLTGWSKYGGELEITGSARSGGAAGLLISNTESTKWAFQAVAIDPAQYYEFSAYLQAGDGVREAHLRISWYPTNDASGPALSTTDSLERAAGPTADFVFLTTGAVQPPAEAASARVRVLQAPLGSAPASLRIDDVSFSTTSAPTPTPSPSGTPPATLTPSATPPVVPLLGALPPTPPGHEAPDSDTAPVFFSEARAAPVLEPTTGPGERIAAPTTVADVAAARTLVRADASAQAVSPENRLGQTREPGEEPPWLWLAGVALVVIGLGGVYAQNRRAAR